MIPPLGTLDDGELAAILAAHQTVTASWSPLASAAHQGVPGRANVFARPVSPAVAVAVAAVARPTLEFGVLISPSLQPGIRWFYAGQPDGDSLVEYRIAADGRHVFERYSAS